MKTWLLSIVGATLITFLIKVIMPEGATKKLLSYVISISIVLIIVTPIKGVVLNGNETIELFETVELNVDESYLKFAMACRDDYYKSVAKSKLVAIGVTLYDAQFIFDENVNGNNLKKILINSDNLVIKENIEHINIASMIKSTLADTFSIDEECVVINE